MIRRRVKKKKENKISKIGLITSQTRKMKRNVMNRIDKRTEEA